jgi:hypothetical protein
MVKRLMIARRKTSVSLARLETLDRHIAQSTRVALALPRSFNDPCCGYKCNRIFALYRHVAYSILKRIIQKDDLFEIERVIILEQRPYRHSRSLAISPVTMVVEDGHHS